MWIVLVVIYLAIIQGLGQLLTRDLDIAYGAPTDVNELWRAMVVPVGASALFAAAVVTYLRWWRPTMVDHRPGQKWLIVIPVLMVLAIVAMTDYSALAAKGAVFTALLVFTVLCVGFAEEMMFRGVGVTMLRSNGFTEGKVALWSTVIFGLAHATNLFTEGPKAFAQVFSTIIAGYFFYLIRRRTGGLVVGMLVHGFWDFSLVSNLVADPSHPRAVAGLGLVTMVVLVVIVLVRRRHIELEHAPAASVTA
jgi:membrane protease YdiL (CAAX protease family)